MKGSWEVEHATSAVVTDLGRTGGPALGLATNGAADQYSATVANILAGNDVGEPLIELTAGVIRLRSHADLLIAVTGAEVRLSVSGVTRATWQPIFIRNGDVVEILPATRGLRAYLSIHGSMDVPRLLGSCAPDTVIGFGRQLRAGDTFPVTYAMPSAVNPYLGVPFFNFATQRPAHEPCPTINLTDGPDIAEFGLGEAAIFGPSYTVNQLSNHIGLRFAGGPVPRRIVGGEVLSRAVPIGAVEAPPGDELLILHRGRAVTAGYPVLGVVASTSLDTLAQVRPGEQVRFRRVDVDTATSLRRVQHQRTLDLAARVRNAYVSLGIAMSSPDREPRVAEALSR